MLSNLFLIGAALSASAYAAAVPAYGQCGGENWTGGTSCVSGYTCTYSNAYYSQCLAGTATQATTVKATTTTAAKVVSTSSTKVSTKASSTSVAASSGSTYKASFTEYGSGDDNDSGNCNVATTACGFYTSVSSIPGTAYHHSLSRQRLT